MPAIPLHALVILTDIEGAVRDLGDVAVGTTRSSGQADVGGVESLPSLRR